MKFIIVFFRFLLSKINGIKTNPYHPTVWIAGVPNFGENVYIGGYSIVNANGANVEIGNNADIASFVTINVADSHKRCIGLTNKINRRSIYIGNNVFIGSHSVVKGGAFIGDYSVVAAGTIVDPVRIPPYSLVYGNPMKIKEGYYTNEKRL